MSRAESHEVGGGNADKEEGGEGGGGLDRLLKERGAGEGVGEGLSLRRTDISKKGRTKCRDNKDETVSGHWVPLQIRLGKSRSLH
jgi:hypothetical protein